MTTATTATSVYQRMLEAEYNRRYYLEQSQHATRWAMSVRVAMWMAGSGVVVAAVREWSSAAAGALGIIVVAATCFEQTFDFQGRAGRCRAHAEMWGRMVTAFKRAWRNESEGRPLSEADRACLETEFDLLSQQDQELPSRRVQERLYKAVLESFGHTA